MFHEDIKKLAKENTYFRDVLFTGDYTQLVLMSLKPNEDIGEEVHPRTDQLIFVIDGDAEATVNEETFGIDEHDTVFIPAGARHNIKNVGDKDLKLYTVYGPPEHMARTVHKTKKDAEENEYEDKN